MRTLGRANSQGTQSAPIRAKLSGPAIRPNRAMPPDSGEQLWASCLPEFRAKSRVLAIRPNSIFFGRLSFSRNSARIGQSLKNYLFARIWAQIYFGQIMVSPAMGAAMMSTMCFLRANCAQHGGGASGGGLICASLLSYNL